MPQQSIPFACKEGAQQSCEVGCEIAEYAQGIARIARVATNRTAMALRNIA